jgi:hypothetical protein
MERHHGVGSAQQAFEAARQEPVDEIVCPKNLD